MEPAWTGAQNEEGSRLWRTALRPAAERLIAEAGELSTTVVEGIARQLPDLLPTAEALEANRASTEASIRLFAAILAAGADPAEATHLEQATIDYAQDGARHGIALTTLFRSYRLGHAATTRYLIGILPHHVLDPDDLTAAIELCSEWLFGYVDVALCLVEDVYVEERDRWLRSAAATRAETIQTLLSGRPIDQDQASRLLRHELHRNHLAAVVWVDRSVEGRDTLALLDAAIRDISSAVGSEHVLAHSLGTLSVAAWISTKHALPAALLDTVALSDRSFPARVALGEPGPGVAGFRTSYREALEAKRVAHVARRPDGSVTQYRQVALQALGSVDPVQCRAFVERELGALFSDDEAAQRIATTVRTYLEENRSRSRTGKKLNIHENTVSYRLRQAEELVGRTLDEGSVNLGAALALVEVCRPPEEHSNS